MVLSCRNNVWDTNVNNGMMEFDIFKAQNFDSNQVNEFIENWFYCTGDKQIGDLLKVKLQEPGRERIRDLVRNPLRLSLLCQTFYINKVDLPETKAALYKRFILYFQEWKQHLYPIDRETQEELHKALGKLALAGINSETKFRFRDSVARQEMGNSLFELACKVDWLHAVDRDIQTEESVFAFFHPNFQEYFAALAINEWHEFLNHVPHNPEQGTYRIFDQQWKEVILLWLGRDDIPELKKAQFTSDLCQFEDKCGGFYTFQAFFLAVSVIAEFKICQWSDQIIEQLVRICVSEPYRHAEPIPLEARSLIIETNREKITKALVILIENCQDENILLLAIKELIKIDKNHQIIKPTLNQLIDKTKDEYNYLMFVWSLGKIDINNQICIKLLVEFIQRSKNEEHRYLAAHALSQLEIKNLIPIETLQDLVENSQNQTLCKHCVNSLAEIAKFSSEAVIALGLIIENIQNEYIVEIVIYLLSDIAKFNPDVINIVVDTISNVNNTEIAIRLIFILQKIAKYNADAIAGLGIVIHESQNEKIKKNAIYYLAEISKYNPLATYVFKLILKKFKIENDYFYRFMLILFARVRKDNSKLFNNFLKSKQQVNSEFHEKDIAFLSLFAGEDNKKIVFNFSELVQKSLNDDIIQKSIIVLSDIGTGNYQACVTLLKLLGKSRNRDICVLTINALKSILTSDLILKIIANLKIQLSNEISDAELELYDDFYQLTWYCARNISYPEFFKAWHGESSLIENLESQFTNIHLQLQATDKILPILINAHALENETDTSAISQEICNEIYFTTFPNVEPPEVSNAPQLKRLIPRIKNQLQTEKLALIFNNCQPNQELIAFCRQITNVVSIAWITDEPIEAPLRGFPPNQPNLLNAIQSWINEIE